MIDFDVPAGTSDSVVIEARLIKGEPSYVEVAVSRLFDFSTESRTRVNLKKVVLSDSNNNEMELETRVPGFYKVELNENTPIRADIGTGYMLHIELLDNRTFESKMDFIQSVPQPSNLHISKIKDIIKTPSGSSTFADKISLSIDTEINSDLGGGMFWEVYNIFKITDTPIDEGIEMKTCYLRQLANVEDIYVLDLSLASGDRLDGFSLRNNVIDFRFSEGLYYEVHQYSLTEGAFSYWRAIDALSERQGTLFDGPVGEIPSNFINTDDPEDSVYGYFFASEEKVARAKEPQEFIGTFGLLCPPNIPPRAGPGGACLWGLCCDCLANPTATTDKPSYWID